MIANDEQLAVVKEQIERLESGLRSFRADQLPASQFRLIAQPFVDDLDRLRAAVDVYLGVQAAREADAALVIALDGRHVGLGETRGSTVTRTIDAVRKGITGILLALQGDAEKGTGGRRPKWIEELTDFPIAGLAPGSVRIMLDEPQTNELFDEQKHDQLRESIYLLGIAVSTAASDEQLANSLKDKPETLRNAILSALREIAPPRGSDIQTIDFAGRYLPAVERMRVAQSTRAVVDSAMKRLAGEEPELLGYVGDIREVDLDNNEFTLRNLGDETVKEVLCEYEDEFIVDVLEYLGTRVLVIGEPISHGKRPKLQVLVLNSATEQEQGDGEASDGRE